MPRTKTPSHVVEFALKPTKAQVREVTMRLDFLRQLYNAALSEIFKRKKKIDKDAEYQALRLQLKACSEDKERKAIYKQLNALNKKYGLTEASIQSFTTANKNACIFSKHLCAHSTQAIATRAFNAFIRWRKMGCGKKGKPRFKSYRRGIRSVEGKAKSCLMIKLGDETNPTHFKWKGLDIPLVLSKKDNQGFESAALDLLKQGAWKYCRIISRKMRGKTKLYLQVLMAGKAFIKARQRNARKLAKGKRVGIDLGPRAISAVSLQQAFMSGLSGDLRKKHSEIAKLQRQNARRLRLANPDNFTSHKKRAGEREITVYKPKRGARNWVKSNGYLATEQKINEMHRKMAVQRKQGHDKLANKILTMGDEILLEKISYRAWQKNFGRSVGASSPAGFVSTLKRKALSADSEVIELNTQRARLSQYDHVNDEYKKKSLSQRTHKVGGKEEVSRDLYSAFLAMCLDKSSNLVSRPDALLHWEQARQRLIDAVAQAEKSMSFGEFFPESLGLKKLKSESELIALK